MEHWTEIADARRTLADQLDGLTPGQWATPSLCGAWTVHDVVAHLVVPHVTSLPRFAVAMVRAGGNFDRASEALTAALATRPPHELLDQLRAHADGRFRPPGFTSVAPLTDVLVHGQDVRLPLGLDAPEPPQAWTPVLGFLVHPKARRGFVPRPLPAVRLVADDVDWAHGTGPEVHGPAAALALALLGRRARLDELDGPGTGVVVGWIPT